MIFKNKILSVVVGLVLVAVIVPAGAMAASLTSAQISAIISLLQVFGADSTTVANVQVALNGGTPVVPPTVWCHTFDVNLGVGTDRYNPEFEALVGAFQREGIIPQVEQLGRLTSGGYDEGFALSVIKFQRKYGILQTGYVGPLTRAKLNALYGCGIACPQYSPPLPGWCDGGTILPPVIGADGCYGPVRCSKSGGITINSISGPTSLNIGQTGTWAVNATAPSGANLTYSVDWGDREIMASGLTGIKPAISTSQTSTFTHSYAVAGTYVVKITVSGYYCDNISHGCTNYPSVQTSLTVVVNSGTVQCNYDSDCPGVCLSCTAGATCGACVSYKCVNNLCVPNTTPSITVTSPNGGEYWFTSSNNNITWNATGFSASDTVQISLYDSSINCGPAPTPPGCWSTFPLVWNGVKNTGNFTWDTNTYFGDPGPNNPLYLSQHVSAGTVYKIKICNGNVCDYSDNYFSIGNPVVYPY